MRRQADLGAFLDIDMHRRELRIRVPNLQAAGDALRRRKAPTARDFPPSTRRRAHAHLGVMQPAAINATQAGSIQLYRIDIEPVGTGGVLPSTHCTCLIVAHPDAPAATSSVHGSMASYPRTNWGPGSSCWPAAVLEPEADQLHLRLKSVG